MIQKWFAIPLWQRVVAALILGILTGWLWGPGAESIKIIGDVFVDFINLISNFFQRLAFLRSFKSHNAIN